MQHNRLFVAIPVPENLHQVIAGACALPSSARRVPSRNLHITLAFIGKADERQVDRALSGVTGDALTITTTQTGLFSRGRALWLGAEGGDSLFALRENITSVLQETDLYDSDGVFVPHITLGRCNKPPPREETKAFLSQQVPPFSWWVDRFVLFSSEPAEGAPVYRRLTDYNLGN